MGGPAGMTAADAARGQQQQGRWLRYDVDDPGAIGPSPGRIHCSQGAGAIRDIVEPVDHPQGRKARLVSKVPREAVAVSTTLATTATFLAKRSPVFAGR